MDKLTRLLFTGVLLALIVNLAATQVGAQYPLLTGIALWILVALVCAFGVFLGIRTGLNLYLGHRYAVEILFLDSANRLLFINHPFHKCLVPPSGRISLWESPHDAIPRILRRETGIEEFELHPSFHSPSKMISERVTDLPKPYAVQMEDRRQRGLVRRHHTFLYVCRFRGEDCVLGSVGNYLPRFLTLGEMRGLGKGQRPFEDLFWRYESLLEALSKI